MPEYEVEGTLTIHVSKIVEADNPEQAKRKALRGWGSHADCKHGAFWWEHDYCRRQRASAGWSFEEGKTFNGKPFYGNVRIIGVHEVLETGDGCQI